MRTAPTQHEMILAALKAGDRLTHKIVEQRFDCTTISQRVGELKVKGHDIKSKTLKWTTRNGVHKTCSEYWMEPEQSELF